MIADRKVGVSSIRIIESGNGCAWNFSALEGGWFER
jgi:hypothetical protein